jgi:hypothetical protein
MAIIVNSVENEREEEEEEMPSRLSLSFRALYI